MSHNHPIRVAILGATGRQGKRRADAVTRVPGMSLVQLSDIPLVATALQELAKKYGCDHATEWEAAIDDPRVDAVLICTPNSRHAEMAHAALKRGKHVLVEKPLANSMSDVAAMVAQAETAGLTLKAGFNYPFRAPIRKGFEHFFAGTIGKLLGMRAVISHSQFMSQTSHNQWFCQPGMAGHGAWLDLGIHVLDLAQWAISADGDEFTTVSAHSSAGRIFPAVPGQTQLDEECVAVYRTRAGRIVTLQASWIDARPFLGARIELIGELGRVEIDLGGRATRLVQRTSGPVTESAEEFAYEDPDPSWTSELIVFRDRVLAGTDRQHRRSDLKVHQLAFAAYDSAHANGQVVSVS
jgi:predicted dehydrogenase